MMYIGYLGKFCRPAMINVLYEYGISGMTSPGRWQRRFLCQNSSVSSSFAHRESNVMYHELMEDIETEQK